MKTVLFILFGLALCNAQETIQRIQGQSPPSANIQDVAWIQGHWQGEAFGGMAEEIWSPPAGTSMMFVFRLLHDDNVSFYEIGHIKETQGTLLMQLKHFDRELKGWEEKEETVDFELVQIEKNAVYFEGLTMKKVSENELNVYVVVEKSGKKEEVLFKYKRAISQ